MVMSLEEIVQTAKIIFASGLCPEVQSTDQAAVLIMRGLPLGMTPVEACQEIRIVRGRMAISAAWIAGKIKGSGKYDFVVTRLDDKGAIIQFYENGKECFPPSDFLESHARAAGVLSNNLYSKYPRNMYYARALTNGARWFCSELFGGSVYTPEELGDESTETQAAPRFELKAVTEKTLTHYDGKLSNGKSTDDYTSERLKQLLTTPSTRKKLSIRDVELIQAAIDARGGSDATVPTSLEGNDLRGDSAATDHGVGTEVRNADSEDNREATGPVAEQDTPGASGPSSSTGDTKPSARVHRKRAASSS